MTLIGTAIGALVALLPPALMPPKKVRPDKADPLFIAGYGAGLKDGRLEAKEAKIEAERLTRSHARLVDHIESLEREILIEQHLCAHWREEAERLARQSREARERQEQAALAHARQADINGRNAMAIAQQAQIYQQQAYLEQVNALQQLGAQAALVAYERQGTQQDFQGFCNCVPSRAQVWQANQGEG